MFKWLKEQIKGNNQKKDEILKIDSKLDTELMRQSISQASDSSDIMGKLLLLIGNSDLELTSKEGKEKKASENSLSASSYLTHGSRILVNLPKLENKEDENKLFNWLSKDTSGQMLLSNRDAATHSVEYTKDKNGNVNGFNEIKTSVVRELFLDVLPKKLLGKETKHWGIDLALPKPGENQESVKADDGGHGHLYVYYEKPTKEKPGAILFGVEAFSPNHPGHSILGKPDPLSATGQIQWTDIKTEHLSEKDKDLFIPKKYNGMKINLSNDQIDYITSHKAEDYKDLASIIPGDLLIKQTDNLKQNINIGLDNKINSKESEILAEYNPKEDNEPSDFYVQDEIVEITGNNAILDTDDFFLIEIDKKTLEQDQSRNINDQKDNFKEKNIETDRGSIFPVKKLFEKDNKKSENDMDLEIDSFVLMDEYISNQKKIKNSVSIEDILINKEDINKVEEIKEQLFSVNHQLNRKNNLGFVASLVNRTIKSFGIW